MRTVIVIAVCCLLQGCIASSLYTNAPSVQHCDKVSYIREGNKVTITADCQLPIGTTPLPVPLPPALGG